MGDFTNIPAGPSAEKKGSSQKQENEKNSNKEQQKDNPQQRKVNTPTAPIVVPSPRSSKSFGNRIVGAVKVIKNFGDKHPIIAEIIKVVAVAAVGAAASSSRGSNGGGASYSSFDNDDSCFSDYDIDSFDLDDYGDLPDKRSSPKGHTVSAHGQRYHTKDGVIWKKKEAYDRGDKHNGD